MTVAVLALVAMPALASAQDTTHQKLDSARTHMQQQPQSGRRAGRGSMGLSHDQVMQLQTALSGAGCDAGTADGVMGPKTRRAMACARRKNNVTTNADLYRSLNLDFPATSSPSGGEPSRGAHERSTEVRGNRDTQGAAAENPASRATRGDSSQVGGRNRGRIRPPSDSTRKPMGARDTTRHDSTSH